MTEQNKQNEKKKFNVWGFIYFGVALVLGMAIGALIMFLKLSPVIAQCSP